jgi:hypothetical protein
MVKYWLICGLVLLLACEGKLTDEQRKKMREQMELHKIKRVTETEITEAAYAKGRALMAFLERHSRDSVKIDSFMTANEGRIRWIVPGNENARELERQLVDAYLADESGALQDNIQRVRRGMEPTDSILYTKPVITKLPDGSERLDGVWNVWLSQKQLVLAMDK